MRIGICTSIDNLYEVQRCGFDYIELSLNAFSLLNDEDFSRVKSAIESSSIQSEACNLFFPAHYRLTGPDIDYAFLREYSKMALDRASQLATKLVVVGCGPQRKYPDGWSKEDAVEQFGKILADVGDEAEAYNIMVTIEPIRSSSTNILNTVPEACELVRRMNHPRVQLMADFYQMIKQGEDVNVLAQAADTIKHIHISDTKTRKCPTDRNDDAYDEMFSALREIRYKGAITIEGSGFDAEDAARAVPFLRMMAKEYDIGETAERR